MREVTKIVSWMLGGSIEEVTQAQETIDKLNRDGFVSTFFAQSGGGGDSYSHRATLILIKREEGIRDKVGRIVQQQSHSHGSVQSVT